jgi:hypothetical protein
MTLPWTETHQRRRGPRLEPGHDLELVEVRGQDEVDLRGPQGVARRRSQRRPEAPEPIAR